MFIMEKKPQSVQAEAYRSLRTNIQYSSFDKEIKVILVTSSNPGEGKTTTVGNLALSLAQDNKKVLIIDCDLRKPVMHKHFKISNEKGLSEVLLGKEEISSTLYRYSDNLDILTTGKIPPNPSEMLDSHLMQRLLEELRERYDYVVLDTAPIQAVTDGKILATKADGTILVVRAEVTKGESVAQTIKDLKNVNAKIIGTILNDVDTKRKNYYCYYYSTEETKKKKEKKNKRK